MRTLAGCMQSPPCKSRHTEPNPLRRGNKGQRQRTAECRLRPVVGDAVVPAGWMGPCSSGCRSDHRHTGSPVTIRNGRPRGPPASGESVLVPAPGWRPSRSISASMRPSRVPPAARPGPDSIPPGGAEETQSEPGYGSQGGRTVPPDCAEGGCSESSAAGPRPATSPPSRSRPRCRAAHSAGGGAARPSAQQPVQHFLR